MAIGKVRTQSIKPVARPEGPADVRRPKMGKAQRAQGVDARVDRLRALGEVAAGVAHELNQPLAGVRGLAEHLLFVLERNRELDQDLLQGRLTQIIQQADRMAHIIDHVRRFARDVDRAELKPVQINEVVTAGLGLLRAQLRSRGIDVSCELAGDLPLVMANPFSLEEVVLNLLTNARDAVVEKEGAQEEWVQVRTRLSGNCRTGEVKIEIEDSGVGIPAALQEKVFTPFFTTKDPEHGTGLGLSISRSIIEQFGGRIDLRSIPGQGTTATVALPVS
jgi:C4-dicarboxylate-specific signal transduction histidine kinase